VSEVDSSSARPSLQTWREESRTCPQCSATFSPNATNQRFCRRECGFEYHFGSKRKNTPVIRRCIECGESFATGSGNHRICSDACRALRSTKYESLRRQGNGAIKFGSRYTRGRYVYAWLDDGVVFYVGRGAGTRLKVKHTTGPPAYPIPAECQARRDRIIAEGRKFSVRVIRDNLTQEGAALLESAFIAYLDPDCNVVRGMKRQEVPPLELQASVLRMSTKLDTHTPD
jgi:hypothetical protein